MKLSNEPRPGGDRYHSANKCVHEDNWNYQMGPRKKGWICLKLKYISASFCNFGHFVFCSPGICTLHLWPGELCTVLRCSPCCYHGGSPLELQTNLREVWSCIRPFSWLKAASTAFTFKNLRDYYAKLNRHQPTKSTHWIWSTTKRL